jgi:flagellar biosynthesis GTPase FlhF
VTKILIPAAALAAVATAASAAPSRPAGLLWVVSPADAACRTEIELVARSGAVTPVTLTSDGQIVSLTFAKPDLPERAFLPIRVDRNRFSNLVLRRADGVTGELVLSEETEAAMRKGKTLDIAWLSEEPVSATLAGSEQGLTDLRVCGAQIASQARARATADAEAKARAEEDARRQAVVQAQLEAARAQTAAADAQRQRVEQEAERQRRQEAQERERLYAEARQQEYQRQYDYEAARRRDYEEARRREYEEDQGGYYRPAFQPRYPIYPQPQASYPPAWGRRW